MLLTSSATFPGLAPITIFETSTQAQLVVPMAFLMGFGARLMGLPPLIGFLATGFLLSTQGIVTGDVLQKLAGL